MVRRFITLSTALLAWCSLAASAVADDNPCAGLQSNAGFQRAIRAPLLYDGTAQVAAPPSQKISLGSAFSGPYKPGCVILQVRFDGSTRPEDMRAVFHAPSRMSSMLPPYEAEAKRVLTALGDLSFLPQAPQPGTVHLIAVPLWKDHIFYKGGASAPKAMAGVRNDAAARFGYPDARYIGAAGGASAFELENRRGDKIFLILKEFAPDEPLLPLIETSKNQYGNPVYAYDLPVMVEFAKLLEPQLPKRPYHLLEIRYYATNEPLDYPLSPTTAPRVQHPQTWQPAAPPVAVAYLRQEGGGPWMSGRDDSGPYPLEHPTLDDLVAAYEDENITPDERQRRRQKALEEERVRYAGQPLPDALVPWEVKVAKARAAVIAREEARKPGFVYKSDRFWQALAPLSGVREIFEGGQVAETDLQFRSHYLAFLDLYGSRCNSQLTQPYVEKTTITETEKTNEYGAVVERNVSKKILRVEQRYWPKFQTYLASTRAGMGQTVGKAAEDLGDGQAGLEGLLSAFMGAAARETAEVLAWGQFFDQVPCASAGMQQMRENVYRIAHGQPVVQVAGTPISGAAAESERLFVPPGQMTYYDACHDYLLYEEPQRCSCLAAEANKYLSAAEKKSVAADFKAYVQKYFWLDRPPARNDPAWRFSEPQRACYGG